MRKLHLFKIEWVAFLVEHLSKTKKVKKRQLLSHQLFRSSSDALWFFNSPHKKKYKSDKSGERGGRAIGPFLPIHVFGYVLYEQIFKRISEKYRYLIRKYKMFARFMYSLQSICSTGKD